MPKNQPWTEEEVRILHENTHLQLNQLVLLLPSHGISSIRWKRQSLGLCTKRGPQKPPTQIGDVYGRLTVLSLEMRSVGRQNQSYAYVKCGCEKQTEKWVPVCVLRSGGSKSCGCWAADNRFAVEEKIRSKIFVGQVFGMLTVISEPYYKKRSGMNQRFATCRCSEHAELEVLCTKLRTGRQTHCGCMHNENIRQAGTTHGASGTRLYSCWCAMRKRCLDTTGKHPRYAGRGIAICDEWQEYPAFEAWALANGYSDSLEIDRIDFDGHYHPENCRWVTRIEQANNKSNNHRETYEGETKTLAEWARDPRCQVHYDLLDGRLRQGWNFARAFTTPVIKPKATPPAENVSPARTPCYWTYMEETKTLADWVRDPRCRVTPGTITERLSRGWSFHEALTTPPYGKKVVQTT